MRAWMVRAGAHGERERASLEQGLLFAGWPELGDISQCATLEDLDAALSTAYPRENSRVLSSWRGQLWRFRSVMAPGDLVVLPNKDRTLAIGFITGDYQFDAEAPEGLRHVRTVEWKRSGIDRVREVRGDLQASLGSLLTISELRRFDAVNRLKALADGGEDPGNPETDEDLRLLRGPAELADKVANAPEDRPVELAVRDFLSIWDAFKRPASVTTEIRRDLDEFGLSTVPPFTEIPIDYVIRVIPVGQAPEAGRHERGEETATLELESDDSGELPPHEAPALHYETAQPAPGEDAESPVTVQRVTVGRLKSARKKPVSVKPDEPLANAVGIMTDNSFDHLAVVDDEGNLWGSISWRELGARNHAANALVRDAAVQKVQVVRTDDLLIDCVQVVADHGFVFVLNPDHSLSGMVTTYDLAHQLREELNPYAFTEEVELRLRRTLHKALLQIKEKTTQYGRPGDERMIQRLHDGKTDFHHYVELLRRADVWESLGWKSSQESFANRIDDIRQIRNDFMHFHALPQGMRAAMVEEIEKALNALRTVDPPN